MQTYIFDLDDHLPPRAKARLHRMKRYRQYVAERARLSDLVIAHIAGGGTCADEPVLSAVQALEALGETLRSVMARLAAEEIAEAARFPSRAKPAIIEKNTACFGGRNMYDIVTIGELLVDFTESGRSAAGMRLFEQNAGGAVANLVAAAAQCGAKTAFIGKVGNDMHGVFLRDAMAAAGVDMHALIFDDDVFTTLAFVALSPSGERAFSFARKPGADVCLRPSELDMDMLTHTRIFHHGSLSCAAEPGNAATREGLRIAKAAGAIISYDPNYRASLWKSESEAITVMRSFVPSADLIKISDEEAALLTDTSDPVEASRILVEQGARVVAVTLGGDGALVRVGTETRRVPGFAVKAVDTTGAGDAFFGGFLSRFLTSGRALSDITIDDAADYARFGNATASLCVEHRGGIPAMPKREAVLARMKG